MTSERKSFHPRYQEPPPIGSAQACASAQVPNSPSLSWRICVKEPNLQPSVNSPHQSKREELRAPARAGDTREAARLRAATPASLTEAEPRPAGPRTHPTLPPTSPPPPDTAGARLLYRGPTAAAGGGGERATPRRAWLPPAVKLRLPRPAVQDNRFKTERRNPLVLAHLVGERETPAHCRAHPLLYPYLGLEPSFNRSKGQSHPPPRGTQEIRL